MRVGLGWLKQLWLEKGVDDQLNSQSEVHSPQGVSRGSQLRYALQSRPCNVRRRATGGELAVLQWVHANVTTNGFPVHAVSVKCVTLPHYCTHCRQFLYTTGGRNPVQQTRIAPLPCPTALSSRRVHARRKRASHLFVQRVESKNILFRRKPDRARESERLGSSVSVHCVVNARASRGVCRGGWVGYGAHGTHTMRMHRHDTATQRKAQAISSKHHVTI